MAYKNTIMDINIVDTLNKCEITVTQLRIMAKHYVAAALWADCEEGTRPRVTKSSMVSAEVNCIVFLSMANPADIKAALSADKYESHADAGASFATMGQDIWFTTRGHGTGFWDRKELTDDVGQRLTGVCERMGEPYYEFYQGWFYLSEHRTHVEEVQHNTVE